MAWFEQLRQASFRGVPFGVLTSNTRVGRRQAVHEYPFRDDPFIEDIGRATRRISFSAFLLEDDAVYGGGPVIAQRDAMARAAETPGSGTLVHPTLGTLTVSVLELTIIEKWDNGRYFELGFVFLESGKQQFPTVQIATKSGVTSGALAANVAAAIDFIAAVHKPIALGAAIVRQAVLNTKTWTAIARSLVNDATSLANLVSTLPGSFGRYTAGGSVGFLSSSSVSASSSATVASLISAGTVARAAVEAAATNLETAAAALSTPSGVPTAAQALSAALLASAVNPADGIRLLSGLADFTPNTPTDSSVIGVGAAAVQTAIGNLYRRAAAVSAAQAAANYQPLSATDAVNVRNIITALLDAEITIAGDAGDDSTYAALRTLRLAVIKDLNTRGAALAPLVTFTFGSPLPSLTLANRLYRDATRSDELTTEANPIHPAFMPVSFQALSR